jgi:SPP1 gp7 family putative phage head morphogenesis protein
MSKRQSDINKFLDFAFDIRRDMLKQDKFLADQLNKKFKNLRSKINKFIKSNQFNQNPLKMDQVLDLIKIELNKIDNFLTTSIPKAQAVIPKNIQNSGRKRFARFAELDDLGLDITNFDIFKPNTKAGKLFKQEFASSKNLLGRQGFYNQFSKKELPIIKDKIFNSFYSGAGWRDVQKDLMKSINLSEFKANTIARTEINEAYRKTTKKAYLELGVQKFIWMSAQDSRTCAICWGLHGQRFNNAEFTIAHPNCRCTLIASVRGADKNVRHPENRFNQLSDNRKKMILGKTRYEKYKNNKSVKLKNFITSDFRRGVRQFKLETLK